MNCFVWSWWCTNAARWKWLFGEIWIDRNEEPQKIGCFFFSFLLGRFFLWTFENLNIIVLENMFATRSEYLLFYSRKDSNYRASLLKHVFIAFKLGQSIRSSRYKYHIGSFIWVRSHIKIVFSLMSFDWFCLLNDSYFLLVWLDNPIQA